METRDSAGLVITRLAPPPQPTHLLDRPRVVTLLEDAADYPLTLLVAPAGSGKTSVLTALARTEIWPLAWCRLNAADDPAQMVLHLAAAFRPVAPLDEERVRQELARVGRNDPAADALEMLVNELAAALSETTLLVLDDYQSADRVPGLRMLIERLIIFQPMRLRLLLASRYEPAIGAISIARARGELYHLGQADLAFTLDETRAFFAQNSPAQVASADELHTLTRGWPLALQLAAGGPNGSALLGSSPQALLDDYLTRQVFDDQPPEIQRFLLASAALRWLDREACAALPDQEDADELIGVAQSRSLFLEEQNGQMAYQPLFRAFLERMAQQRLPGWLEIHHWAADYYRARNDAEGVIHHLLMGGRPDEALAELVRTARLWIEAGHTEAVLAWATRIPRPFAEAAELLEVCAAALRRNGHFTEAIARYEEAERAYAERANRDGQVRCMRGLAEVYLDTVQPAPATALLKRALKLLPRERQAERGEILRLQAENWINSGRADVAMLLESAAHRMEHGESRPVQRPQPADAAAPPRLLLRSGRLHEARRRLEADLHLGGDSSWNPGLGKTASAAAVPPHSLQSAHREPLLLLALIYTLLGNGVRALAVARRGLLEAQAGDSPLTQAVAFMRVGHAYQLISLRDPEPAEQCYRAAHAIIQHSGVLRTRAEVCLGLALLYGHGGNLGAAETVAAEGLQIAEAAGDEWSSALLWTALCGAAVTVGHDQAPDWLQHAGQRFKRGGDSYGRALVALWTALWHTRHGDDQEARAALHELFELVKRYGYEGLLTTPTLFGPRDLAMLVPLLLIGRRLPEHAELASQLLRQSFPSIASDEAVEDYHPGFTLRIQMLGAFRVWRGWHEIQARDWQREKARQLFQLLLTYRGHWIQREQICAWLWPDTELEAAERQFKVTLNALNAALEPQRPPRTSPFFIRRQGLAYSFAPSFGVWIDVDEFELRIAGASSQDDPEFALRNSQMAVQLYKGDYLAESLYDAWTLEERERLLARYLANATVYADQLLAGGDLQGAVQLCEQVLRRDRGYEEVYQVLMRAHARSGSRSQAMRSYNRCVQALRDDLGIEPLPETTELYERVKRNEKI